MPERERVRALLERAAEYYESYLWESEIGASVRARLADDGLGPESLRTFEIGYAPGDWRELLEHLGGQFSVDELDGAGIAMRSRRGLPHVVFRSRVMFPIRDPDGDLAGFGGLATNPGPSWPRWITSPETEAFSRGAAVFAIDRAAAGIRDTGRAVLFGDPCDLLRLDPGDRANAVALVRSNLGDGHLQVIAATLDVDPERLASRRDGDQGPFVFFPAPHGAKAVELAAPSGSGERRLRPTPGRLVADRAAPVPLRVRAAQALLACVIGAGVPTAALLITQPSRAIDPRSELPGFVAVIAGAYLALALAAGLISARVRARSRARRMREPWARGSSEWQPSGWTYHSFEEVLIASAILSMIYIGVVIVVVGRFPSG
ncbi:MAG: hypothetical protein ACJ75R_03315 [Solirubrobacterales bacterium]